MAQEEAELVSLSGSPIYRHEAPEPGFHPPTDAARFLDEISDHLEQHLGPIEAVFHEIISEFAHIDVHWIPPNPKRPCHTLVSSGMSDAEMTLPDGVEVTPFAELFITLPPTWSISEEAFRDEANYWPLRLLKTLARLPATYNTWLGFGHTVPNGDPAEPYDDSTELCGAIVLPLAHDFARVRFADDEDRRGDRVLLRRPDPSRRDELQAARRRRVAGSSPS